MNIILKGLLAVMAASSMIGPSFKGDVLKASVQTNVASAFQGPFVYEGETTVTYKYLSEDCNDSTYKPTLATKEIDESKTVTITEKQLLTYYLHTPINYDPGKSYPIISFMSGDGISIFCDGSIGGTKVDISEFVPESDYYCLHDKYRQNETYGDTFINAWGKSIDTDGYYLSDYYEFVGNKKQALKLPHFCANGGNCDDQFVYDWVDMVYGQGKEEYDCFFLFLQPTDREAFENKSNKKILCIQNELQAKSICDKYDESVIKAHDFCNSSCITSTYVSSELSIDPTEQLLCQLIDRLMSKYSIDRGKQYVAGFSLGAMFSYDICCHYPDRFACALTSGLPTLDFSDANIEAWTKTNFWGFNGSGDYCDANGAFTKDFVSKVNSKKNSDSDVKTYYSVCSGGHSGMYIGGDGMVVEGRQITTKTDVYDFLFACSKPIECLISSSSSEKAFEDIKLGAIASEALDEGTYDLAFVSGAPLGDFYSHGFVIESTSSVTIEVEGQVKHDAIILGDKSFPVNATDYNSALLYYFVLKSVPSTITAFRFKGYAQSKAGVFYSKEMGLSVSFDESRVLLEVCEL